VAFTWRLLEDRFYGRREDDYWCAARLALILLEVWSLWSKTVGGVVFRLESLCVEDGLLALVLALVTRGPAWSGLGLCVHQL